jgi:hypothetical protein
MAGYSRSISIRNAVVGAMATLLAVGATAVVTAAPAMASATSCAGTGSGYASYRTGSGGLYWYQIWYKKPPGCLDFYMTGWNDPWGDDSYRGFYKAVSASVWNEGSNGWHYEVNGNSPSGIALVTNVATGTQLTVVAYDDSANESDWMLVAF